MAVDTTGVEVNRTWQAIIDVLSRSFQEALNAGARVMLTVYIGEPGEPTEVRSLHPNAGEAASRTLRQRETANRTDP